VKRGDLVSSSTFGITGIIVQKWMIPLRVTMDSYQGTAKILKDDGGVITLDIHGGDVWRVIS
jgi:hypothetical protein